jgi:hypothetical protein
MKQTLSYWLDSVNVICRVDEDWDRSMDSENWTDRAASQSIIGKPLFDFICDDVTRMYIATMVESVRVLPRTLFRPYRCDTPDFKRFMMMTVTPEDDGLVRVSHELLRTEPMAKKTSFKTVSPTEQSASAAFQSRMAILGTHFIRCSLCNRIRKVGQNDWQEADSVAVTSEAIRVVYGLCPRCMQ